MKKSLEIILLAMMLIFIIPNKVKGEITIVNKIEVAEENETSTQDIIEEQKSSLNISEFIAQSQKYTENIFGETDFNKLLNSAMEGKVDNNLIGESVLNLLGKEFVGALRTISTIMVIIVIHSILKNISEGLENKSISHIAYYVQYILIVTIIMSNFSDIVTMVRNSINSLVAFSNLLVPLLMTLVLTTGNVVSVSMMQPLLLFLITFIGNFVANLVLPIVLASTVLAIVSKVSDKIQLDKLSKFFKSSAVWILGVVLTAFVTLLSVEGTLSSSVDGVTAKTAKAAVSSFIPVVGKILGDAVDTVIGCTSILKNAVGIVGVIVILGICISPIIKLTLLMGTYYLGAAICQPIADEKIVKLLEQIGDTFKILLAILCSISVMLIIGTTLVMKISNSGLMYR